MNEAHYFRVGLFVLAGIVVAVATVVVVGGGRLFDRPVVIETVFEESVQGLDVGAPVKLRGVRLGSVRWIGFVGDEYQVAPVDSRDRNRVLVRMEIVERGPDQDRNERLRRLEHMVDRGLRLRLTPLGITGVSFIEADFLDAERFPVPPISWEPEVVYVPSAPSTISQITSAAERLMTRIDALDVEGLLTNLDELLVNVNAAVETTDVENVQRSVSTLLADLEKTSAALRSGVEDLGAKELGEDLRASLRETTVLLGQTQHLLGRSGEDLAASLENLRTASRNLRDASETARAYPSFFLFGETPTSTLEPAR
jgi:ABC-type transporter Mla subunit MlaD